MSKLSKIGSDLYYYFLSIYPEKSTVSLCMSEKLFYQFVNKYTDTKNAVQNGFINIDLKDAYACLTIAVYQSTLFVRKNIHDASSYNKELYDDLSIKQNELQNWYKNNQEKIWTKIVSNLFSNKSRDIITPELKKGAYRYVQYPSSQFIIDTDQVKSFNKSNLDFDEYSKRNFSKNKRYYDSNKKNFILYFYNYSEENLNYIAKRIIYSFVVNDIKFLKLKQLNSESKKLQSHTKIDEELHLRIEDDNIYIIPTKDHFDEIKLFLNSHFYKLFIYDNKNIWWDYYKSRKIDINHKYGLFMKKTSFNHNNDTHSYINRIINFDNDYIFIEVNENEDSIKSMCNVFHLIYNLDINFSFIGGMRNKYNEYYYFSLPTITLKNKASELYINDAEIKVSSDTYNLNDYIKYIKEGENKFKTESSEIYTLKIKKKQEVKQYTNILGKIIDKKNYSVSYSYPYHIQGLYISNSIPQINQQGTNNFLPQYKNPIFRVINKKLKAQLQKGKINVV